jgi:multidrug efflux system outer membrane protein
MMRMPQVHFPVCAAAIVLAGCAAKPPKEIEDALAIDAPAKYSSRGERTTSDDDDWVKQLSKDATLTKLIMEVREKNWDIKKAALRMETAGTNARLAGARLFPIAAVGLDGRRAQQAFIGFPGGPSGGEGGDGGTVSKSLTNNFGVSLDVSWELDLWGRIRAGQEASIAEFQASKEDLRGVASSLSAQTAKVWFALMEARDQSRLAEQSLVSFRNTETTLRDSFELGNGSAAQLRVATSDVDTSVALLEERNGQVRAAQRQLEVLLGRYPKAEIESSGGLPEVPKQPPAGIPSTLLERRSDLVAAERRMASAARRVKEGKLALLPQISLTGSGGRTSDVLRDLTTADFGVWSIGANATQTLFRGGEVLGNLKLREIALREAKVDYQRVAMGAFNEVETRLDNEVILRRREAAMRRAEKNLIGAYERSLQEYRDGVGSSTALLTNQRRLLSVSGQVLTLRRLRLDNRVDLHLALGGSIKKTF